MPEMEDKEVIKDPNASEGEGEVAENTEGDKQESTQEEVKEKSEDESKESEIDYAAELEKERKLRENEVTARKKAEDKIVQLKRDSKKSEEQDDDDPYGLNELVDERIAATVGNIKQQIVGDVIEEELDKISSNASEKELIKFHYDNTIRQSGSSRSNIIADLDKAKLLANHKRIEMESKEAINAALNRPEISTSTGSNQDKIRPDAEPKFNPQELEILKRRGIDPKTVKID
jgi:membrane-associated HD superfamily phosphohydrolase